MPFLCFLTLTFSFLFLTTTFSALLTTNPTIRDVAPPTHNDAQLQAPSHCISAGPIFLHTIISYFVLKTTAIQ